MSDTDKRTGSREQPKEWAEDLAEALSFHQYRPWTATTGTWHPSQNYQACCCDGQQRTMVDQLEHIGTHLVAAGWTPPAEVSRLREQVEHLRSTSAEAYEHNVRLVANLADLNDENAALREQGEAVRRLCDKVEAGTHRQVVPTVAVWLIRDILAAREGE